MGFRTLFTFVFILLLQLTNNIDFGIMEKYTNLHEPGLEMYYLSLYDEEELFENEIKTRTRRQSANAAPTLKDVDRQLEEFQSAGSSVIIKCEPKGTSTPNITWFKDNVTPVKRTDRGGVLPVTYDMWSLLLYDLVPEDSGNYTCRICNPIGCTEHVQRLTITGYPKQFPYIRKGYPGNLTVLVNNSILLTCPTVNLTDYSVKWARLIAGAGHNASQEVFQKKDKYALSYNTLTIKYATKEDEGWYMCITNNTIGTDRATGFLRVSDYANGPSNGDPTNNGSVLKWLTPALSILLIICLIAVVVVFLKLKSERLLKRHAVETAREVMFEQWMKVVTIETERCNGYTPEGTLIDNRIRRKTRKALNSCSRISIPASTRLPADVVPPLEWRLDQYTCKYNNIYERIIR